MIWIADGYKLCSCTVRSEEFSERGDSQSESEEKNDEGDKKPPLDIDCPAARKALQ